jgi:CRISPR-associated protein Cas2
MRLLVTYDICDDRRLRRVAKINEDFGARVQKSVFECNLRENQLLKLKRRLQEVMAPEEDSVRIYRLCARCAGSVEVIGTGVLLEDEEVIIT